MRRQEILQNFKVNLRDFFLMEVTSSSYSLNIFIYCFQIEIINHYWQVFSRDFTKQTRPGRKSAQEVQTDVHPFGFRQQHIKYLNVGCAHFDFGSATLSTMQNSVTQCLHFSTDYISMGHKWKNGMMIALEFYHTHIKNFGL